MEIAFLNVKSPLNLYNIGLKAGKEFISYTKIIPKWDIYGHFLNYKAKNIIYFPQERNKKNSSIYISLNKNSIIEEKTTFNLEERERFLIDAKSKLFENNLDYNEFLYFYSYGLPNKRKTLDNINR